MNLDLGRFTRLVHEIEIVRSQAFGMSNRLTELRQRQACAENETARLAQGIRDARYGRTKEIGDAADRSLAEAQRQEKAVSAELAAFEADSRKLSMRLNALTEIERRARRWAAEHGVALPDANAVAIVVRAPSSDARHLIAPGILAS